MDRVRELIKTTMIAKGLNNSQVSREVLKKNHAYLHQYFEKGTPKALPEEVRDILGPYLGLRPDDLKLKIGDEIISAREHISNIPTSPANQDVDFASIRTEGLVGQNETPIYASAQGGNGEMMVSYEAIEFVKKPEPLLKVTGGFGMYVVGDSMIPAYAPGDLALFHPSRPPVPGDDILIIFESENGMHNAILKRLISDNGKALKLQQFNPAKGDISVSKDKILSMNVCVGKYNRR